MDYVRGRKVDSPVPVLRLICVADALEWKHLPVAGGIYDQHPDFVEAMMMLFEERGKYEREKQKQEESKANQQKQRMPSHPRRGR